MEVKIINKSKHELPKYATPGSAGFDLRANLEYWVELTPMSRAIIPTGLFIELPRGHEAQIRPRSGLAYNFGVTVLNSPGTIDADYRGEIKVLLVNLSPETVRIHDGERVAQMVVAKYETISLRVAEVLEDSERGTGGFGHTGRN